MSSKKNLILWLFLLLLVPVTAIGQYHDGDWLEQGLLAEFRGEYKQALDIWQDAREELDEPDSRIGFEYIRVATEQELADYYEKATEMYYWAISSPFEIVNRAAVRQEIERLRPIVGNGIYRQWINWFEERNTNLASDLRGFWVQMDPTPGNIINERLIEHWHRIAYSRANFVKNNNTVYRTDDRALIYIRYGEPEKKHAGVLTLDNQNLGQWLARQFDSARTIDDPEENPPVRLDFNRDRDRDQNNDNGSYYRLEEYVFKFHQYPEYEIWIYSPLTESDSKPLIFIFGTDLRTNEFHKQGSIDDFIPQRAYLSDGRSQQTIQTDFVRAGLTPALALQMLYYEQLIDVDSFFQERLNYIRESYIDQGPLAYKSLDLSLRSQNREMLQMRTNEAPLEISSLGRMLPGIPLEIHQYRLLDEDNNPIIISFVESAPGRAILQDMEVNRELYFPDIPEMPESDTLKTDLPDKLDDYQLDHKFIVYNRDWIEKKRDDDTPLIRSFLDKESGIIQSVFISGHDYEYYQSAAASLINKNPESKTLYPSIFPEELRGLGTLKNRQPVPLKPDPDQLELGDLILGFRDELPEDYPFNFRVANDQMIPGDQSLILHFQVYNLQPRPTTGFTHFELTYRIYPVMEDGSLLTDEEMFYLTINFEHDETRLTEDLEIQTAQLSSGLYELQVMIEDQESGQEQRKDIRFEVTSD
jgi:GWxTD domain-containing protein